MSNETKIEMDIQVLPLVDRIERVVKTLAHYAGRAILFCPLSAPDYMSEHNRGGGPELDRALYEEPNPQMGLW